MTTMIRYNIANISKEQKQIEDNKQAPKTSTGAGSITVAGTGVDAERIDIIITVQPGNTEVHHQTYNLSGPTGAGPARLAGPTHRYARRRRALNRATHFPWWVQLFRPAASPRATNEDARMPPPAR